MSAGICARVYIYICTCVSACGWLEDDGDHVDDDDDDDDRRDDPRRDCRELPARVNEEKFVARRVHTAVCGRTSASRELVFGA